ncbi:MAG: hypothetical protein IKF71_04170 [Bacilli bacterium]|nr:hypothetical protein [Bacilli bacterium]
MANDKKNKSEEDVKQKNYVKNSIILVALFCGCIFLTLYFCRWYEVYKEYEKEIPIIRGVLFEITPKDLEHYVVDNSSAIVYLCTANGEECRSFEKDFKKYVQKNGIAEEVVYLNLTGVDQEEFVDQFNNRYPSKHKLSGKYPAFVVFQDGKVSSILQGGKNVKITLSKVQNFLEVNLYEEEEEELIENEE